MVLGVLRSFWPSAAVPSLLLDGTRSGDKMVMHKIVNFFMCDLPLYRWWMTPLVLSEILIMV